MLQVSTRSGAVWQWYEYGGRLLAYDAFLKRIRKAPPDEHMASLYNIQGTFHQLSRSLQFAHHVTG